MNQIVGHDRPITAFLTAMRGPKLHHAWLFTGPKGVGKASTAKLLAKRLLSEAAGPPIGDDGYVTPPGHRIGRLIDGYAHPDFSFIDRLPKDLKEVRDLARADWPANLDRARSIVVDQIRDLNRFFALKPSFSDRRIVIIDSIDDLETSGANALLKNLEEPAPGTIFLLVSHAPGKLLPTIRSRCRIIRFDRLAQAHMSVVMNERMPQIGDVERNALILASDGSPGKAVSFSGLGISELDNSLSLIAKSGDPSNALRSKLVQALTPKSAQKRYEAFLARVPQFIGKEARKRTGEPLMEAYEAWAAARILADSALRQSLDVQMTVFAMATHVVALAPKASSSKG